LPVEVGSYAVSASISDGNYEGAASGTLVIGGIPLSDWKTDHFTTDEIAAGAANDDVDPDHDGWDNLAEYALGSDPHRSSPALSASLGADGLTITFTRPKDLPDVTYAAESSGDLVTWSPVTITLVTDGSTQTLRATDPNTSSTASHRFLRLKFTR
jgi:hypothetical protein